jgi:alpha-L-rhamnosidase
MNHGPKAACVFLLTLAFAHAVAQVPAVCDRKKTTWQGRWIWLNQKTYRTYTHTGTTWIKNKDGDKGPYRALFRKSFTLTDLPHKAICFVTGDVSFRLYVNGSFVCKGPVNIGSDYVDSTPPAYWYYTAYDIRPFLKKGRNTIAAEVFGQGLEASETTSSYGRFLCEVSFDGHLSFCTNSTWRCSLDSSFRRGALGLQFDAGLEQAGWKNSGFDDSRWKTASEKGTPDPSFLFPNKIPLPVRKKWRAVSANVPSEGGVGGKKSLLFDYGRVIPAYISFSLWGHRGDTVVVMPYEKFGHGANRSFCYICREGYNTYTSPSLASFRYLQVATATSIRLQALNALFSSYPVRYRGSFACSDPFYTRLWDIVRWSTQLCMNDMFYDSPNHQEPIGCTGDYFIESMNNYYCFGDQWLTRQNLVQTARMLEKEDYKMFHTSYSLLWIQMMRQYFQYTGDTALVGELMPFADKLLARFATYLDTNYLVSKAPNYMFMDWISIDGFNAHHPPAVIGMGYLTAFYYKALIDAASLFAVVGSDTRSGAWRVLAEKVKQGINSRLWDAGKGLYKDGIPYITTVQPNRWLPADTNLVTYSPHINTLAVLYDIAPAGRQDSLMDYVIRQKDHELQPYFMSYVLAAMQHIQQTDKGLALVDRWENGIDTTTHTLKENWADITTSGYSGDYSHAWGGAALLYLSRTLLGVAPELPGYDTIALTPCTTSRVTWARGAVPIGKNARVDVAWNELPDSRYSYRVSIPAGYMALLHVPVFYKTVRINGKKMRNQPAGILLSSGRFLILY